MCVRLMLRGETASVTAAWARAYEGRGDAPAGLAPGSRVVFEVELVGFERQAHQHQLEGAQRLERCARLKEQGNALFKQVGGRWRRRGLHLLHGCSLPAARSSPHTGLHMPAVPARALASPVRLRDTQGKTRLARQKYGKALQVVERALDLETDEQMAAASALKASCLLNMARCAEREQEWGEALGWCNKAIRCACLRACVCACGGEERRAAN